jgi:hypothetical protein
MYVGNVIRRVIEKSKVDMFTDTLKNYYYSVLHAVIVYSCNYMCCGHVGIEYQIEKQIKFNRKYRTT